MPHSLRLLLLAAALSAAAPLAAQPLRCELNGESVNPANGNTTAGKTGLMRCRTEDGNLQREEELRNGKFMGKRVFYSRDGRKEHLVNEKGNLDGPAREYYPDGKLREEATYANGERVGVLRRYYPGGQLERLSFAASGSGANYERGASLEYLEDGKLRNLQCGTRSLMAEDRTLCGFNGQASQVELFRASRGGARLDEKRSYKDGVLVERIGFNEDGQQANSRTLKDGIETTREYYPDGKPRRELSLRQASGSRTRLKVEEREWASNGQLILERRYPDGVESTTLWYMNGHVKQKSVPEGNGLIRVENYFDTGMLRLRETTRAGRTVGKAEAFDEAGMLREESVHDERGTLKSRRTYDERGKLTADEEFFEDGSRKLK